MNPYLLTQVNEVGNADRYFCFMKAIIYNNYGSPAVLKLRNIEKPFPGDNELLIKIKATAVNSADIRLRKPDPWAVRLFFGILRPRKKILGAVLSGEVVQIGRNVKLFRKGDLVFGTTGMHLSTYAEYVSVKETAPLAVKPENLSHCEAAVIPFGATTALYFLKKAKIKAGQKVLILGASGAIGTAAVQLAKYFGAHVTGVCSTEKMELVRTLGADKTIDYKNEDFTKNGETYDVIFQTVDKAPFLGSLRSLNKKGTLIQGASMTAGLLGKIWAAVTSSKRVIGGMSIESAADMSFCKMLIEIGQLIPVIDKIYPLEQTGEAHAYVEKGLKKGNVAISVSSFFS